MRFTMKKLIILGLLLMLAGPAFAADNEFIICGGTPGNYEYLVWDDTAGSMEYALASGTEGPLTLTASINRMFQKLFIIMGD